MAITAKRVYDAPSDGDGLRIFVDRLWPRGISKKHANIDIWLKDIAPSKELRQWFSHDPDKWVGFKGRYTSELKGNASAVNIIREAAKKQDVTLLYAAKDKRHNNAVALLEFLSKS